MAFNPSTVRPEWQPAIVGWKMLVASRPDLGLKSNQNALRWFLRHHGATFAQSDVIRKVNGSWFCDTRRFPECVFDALLGIASMPGESDV